MENTLNYNNIDFHPVLKDIENLMTAFVLQNCALANPEIQAIMRRDPSISSLLNKYNKSIALYSTIDPITRKYVTETHIPNNMIIMGKTIAILTYDMLLASTYNSLISEMEEMQFLKCIRNGAAHNNKFNIIEWKLNPDETIKWNGKTIGKELHGDIVFPDFTNMFKVFLLANFFSEKLKEIDKT